MSKPKPSSVTLEEAVARMVNMDYIPTGFTLLDMTATFLEEAEVAHENAKIDQLPKVQIEALSLRMESCMARHALARWLLESLQNEIKNPKQSKVVLAEDSSSLERLTLESVADWAADRFGIGIPEWLSDEAESNDSLKNVRWEDVTIKIWADNWIGYSLGQGEYKKSSFRKIGLMDERKNSPNWQGGILLGLSKGIKFPDGEHVANKDAAAMSKLRRALQKLTGLSLDPFSPFNPTDGWKPLFALIDDRSNADDRAKKRAVHVRHDDTRMEKFCAPKEVDDYEREDDDAQRWLDENS